MFTAKRPLAKLRRSLLNGRAWQNSPSKYASAKVRMDHASRTQLVALDPTSYGSSTGCITLNWTFKLPSGADGSRHWLAAAPWFDSIGGLADFPTVAPVFPWTCWSRTSKV